VAQDFATFRDALPLHQPLGRLPGLSSCTGAEGRGLTRVMVEAVAGAEPRNPSAIHLPERARGCVEGRIRKARESTTAYISYAHRGLGLRRGEAGGWVDIARRYRSKKEATW
jgi:hypothetical protein